MGWAVQGWAICTGFPVEFSTLSEKRYACVWLLNVDGCTWIGVGWGGGREHERSRKVLIIY